jgi:hypothetical protein
MHASRFALTFSMWLRVSAGDLPSQYRATFRAFKYSIWLRIAPDESIIACPRGLSGAPVLERRGDLAVVAGMVIGNERMEMNVLTEREVVSEGEKTIFERYEALNLGIALQSRSILGLGPFKVLNGRRIREHLAANSLFGV